MAILTRRWVLLTCNKLTCVISWLYTDCDVEQNTHLRAQSPSRSKGRAIVFPSGGSSGGFQGVGVLLSHWVCDFLLNWCWFWHTSIWCVSLHFAVVESSSVTSADVHGFTLSIYRWANTFLCLRSLLIKPESPWHYRARIAEVHKLVYLTRNKFMPNCTSIFCRYVPGLLPECLRRPQHWLAKPLWWAK
jgi:hypothetical protein